MDPALLLAVVLITWLLLVGVGIGVFWWRLDRRNRVVASRSTCAPLSWLVAPTRPAALHRRLRTVAARAPGPSGPSRPPPAGTAPGSVEANRQARGDPGAAPGPRPVVVSRLPRAGRRPQLASAASSVRQLEELGRRLRALEHRTVSVAGAPAPYDPSELDRLDRLVQHHEQAVAELDALERANGLGEPLTPPALSPATAAPPPTAAAPASSLRHRS